MVSSLAPTVTYSIREAVSSDIEVILDLCKTFYAETEYPQMRAEFDVEAARQLVATMIFADKDNGCFVGETEGKVVAVLGCMIIPHMLFKKERLAVEPMWYVDKAHRNSSVGIQLLQCYHEWAADKGCKRVLTDCLDERVRNMLVGLGYKHMNYSMIKELP